MKVSFTGLSTPGPTRKVNEDTVSFWQPEEEQERQQRGSISVMADGVGGHGNGEIASRMAVDIAVKDHAIHAGIPHALFEVALQDQNVRNRFAGTRDGKKFLAVVRVNEKPVNSFMVIVNWPSLLRKR